ncbi:winged helix-turn-helix transcriptional regulator [Halobacillus massiliensis]|uniref:winged helix-turn-helix transcriptional regulator n=1 Tax=Halobacillus massiliensis TaxID=1926286 RepID=UPI0009E3A478|nr:helix-turn-helix domain-containing protein [Halobacillus massiliensis]
MNKSVCPRFERAIKILSQRWTGLIIHQLLDGSKRFKNIETAIGISGKVLSDRLKDMEQQGLIKREVFAETPVRIEYSLTEKGQSLTPIIKNIESWSQEWMDNEEDSTHIK